MITVVSGLPRSGTSMMMQMLEAGGVAMLTDGVRTADVSNPKGYFEDERVKKLGEDAAWLGEADGRGVKIISHLILHLPPDRTFKVIFMRRDIEEILASQEALLASQGKGAGDANVLRRAYTRHLREVETWLAEQANIEVLYVRHRDVVRDPAGQAERVSAFLGGGLDVDKMVSAVDPALHRQRG